MWSYDVTSEPTAITADGSRHVLKVVSDRITATIRVECYDNSLASGANFYPGKTGALVLKSKLRGNGSTTSTSGTATFAEAVFVGYSSEAPNDGTGRIIMNFQAFDSDDSGYVVAWS